MHLSLLSSCDIQSSPLRSTPSRPFQVLKLLRRRERWLVVAAIRFLRTALGMKVRTVAGLAGAQLYHYAPASFCSVPCPRALVALTDIDSTGQDSNMYAHLRLQDEFYNRYLVKNHLLAPVVAAFMGKVAHRLIVTACKPLAHASTFFTGQRSAVHAEKASAPC